MEVFYHLEYTPSKQFLCITIRFSKQKATFELKIFTLLRTKICQRMILLYPMPDKKLIYSDPQNYNELLILMRTQCTAWHIQGDFICKWVILEPSEAYKFRTSRPMFFGCALWGAQKQVQPGPEQPGPHPPDSSRPARLLSQGVSLVTSVNCPIASHQLPRWEPSVETPDLPSSEISSRFHPLFSWFKCREVGFKVSNSLVCVCACVCTRVCVHTHTCR